MAHFLALANESYKALLTFFFWKKWNYLKHEHTGVVVSNYQWRILWAANLYLRQPLRCAGLPAGSLATLSLEYLAPPTHIIFLWLCFLCYLPCRYWMSFTCKSTFLTAKICSYPNSSSYNSNEGPQQSQPEFLCQRFLDLGLKKYCRGRCPHFSWFSRNSTVCSETHKKLPEVCS